MLSFWDSTDKSALRIDLWTKDMMVDEMADFLLSNNYVPWQILIIVLHTTQWLTI